MYRALQALAGFREVAGQPLGTYPIAAAGERKVTMTSPLRMGPQPCTGMNPVCPRPAAFCT